MAPPLGLYQPRRYRIPESIVLQEEILFLQHAHLTFTSTLRGKSLVLK